MLERMFRRPGTITKVAGSKEKGAKLIAPSDRLRKCRIVIAAAYEPIHPSVHDLASVLKQLGYEIILVGLQCTNPLGPPLPDLGLYEAVYEFAQPRWLDGSRVGAPARRPLARLYDKIMHRTASFFLPVFPATLLFPKRAVNRLAAAIKSAPFDFILAIDKGGMGLAAALNEDGAICYYSLELYTKTDILTRQTPLVRALWKLERRNSGRIECVVIQDESRWQILRDDLDLIGAEPAYLPLSEFPAASSVPSAYWHRKYGLPRETKILLCYGAIRPERSCLDIARSAPNLPPQWTLIFHGPCTDRTETEILHAASGAPVIVSRELVDFEKRNELVAGADIGLAIYDNVSVNDVLTGRSSEKIALYLKWGCPVIARRYPSYEHLEDAHCAYLIDHADEIPATVAVIERDLESCSRAAKDCFERYYRADKNLRRASRKILAAMARKDL